MESHARRNTRDDGTQPPTPARRRRTLHHPMGQLGYRKTRHRQHRAKRQNRRKHPARRIHIHRPARRKLAMADSFMGMARPLRTTPARLYSRPLLVCRHRHSSASAVLPRDTPMGTLGAGVQRQRQLPAPGLRARGTPLRRHVRPQTHSPGQKAAALLYTPQASLPATTPSTPTPHENARADVCISTDSSATPPRFIPCHTA